MRVVAAMLVIIFAAPAWARDDKMVLVGAGLFGGAYSPVAVVGTVYGIGDHSVEAGGMYLLPVAGPIAYGSIMALVGSEPYAALLIADGVVQLGGLILMIVGAKRPPPQLAF